MSSAIKWMKYLTRPTFTPLWLQGFMEAYENEVPAEMGVGVTAHLFLPSEKGVEWYVPQEEFSALGSQIVARIEGDPDFAESFRKKSTTTNEALVEKCREIGQTDFESKLPEELLGLYQEYTRAFRAFVVSLAVPPAVDKLLTGKVEEGIRAILEKRGMSDSFDGFLASLTTATEATEAMEEEIDLLETAAVLEDSGGVVTEEIDRKLEAHTEKYRWQTVYAFHLDPLTKDFYLAKAREVDNPKRLLEEKKHETSTRRARFDRAIEDLEPSKPLRALIETLQGYILLRTYNTDMLRKAFLFIQPLINEIGKRAKLSRNEVAYLTEQELHDFLSGGSLPGRRLIQERMEHFSLLKKPGVYRVESNEAKILKIANEELGAEGVKTEVLEGRGIYPGTARGIVRIVRDLEDARRLEEGDVLVASMTTPELHFAMAKAAAIVTDEGGMTCHAAMVSRELQIPCVIATERATKMLRDGDVVDVDSKQGTVRRVSTG